MSVLSFEEIIQGRDSSVRVTDDSLLYAVDLVMAMTGHTRDNAGKTLRRLDPAKFHPDKLSERQISSRGGPMTKLVTFENALLLVMILPGETAKEVRIQFRDIIQRYLSGDKTLKDEIDVNAASNTPIALLARGNMSSESDLSLVGFKRRREELELFRLEHEINTLIVENRAKEQTRLFEATAELERIRDPTRTNMDERTRLLYQDTLQNTFLNTQVVPPAGQQCIANGPSPNTPISISSVAVAMGYKPTTDDSKRIGMDLRKRYIQLHGKPPPKHDQLCDGRVTSVNSYVEQDRPLLVDALHAYFRPSD